MYALFDILEKLLYKFAKLLCDAEKLVTSTFGQSGI
jgi:hypothetical protein